MESSQVAATIGTGVRIKLVNEPFPQFVIRRGISDTGRGALHSPIVEAPTSVFNNCAEAAH